MSLRATIRTVQALGNTSGAVAIDASKGNCFTATLTGDATFTVSNVKPGYPLEVIVTQDATGGHGITWAGQAVVVPVGLSSSPSAAGTTSFSFISSTTTASRITLTGSSSTNNSSVASQANWYISYATGDDNSDGSTLLTALKTPAEWTNRTRGVTPTASLITVTIVDTNAAAPPAVEIAYAIIPSGTILNIAGTPTTITSTTVTTWRGQTTATNTARAITQAAANWAAAIAAPYRIRFTGVGKENAICWPVVDEGANVGRVTAPYGMTIASPLTTGSGVLHEGANADTFVLESLPIIQTIVLESALNNAATSLAGNVVVSSLQFDSVLNPAFFTADTAGGGDIVFWGCNLYSLGGHGGPHASFVACKLDTMAVSDSYQDITGCYFYLDMEIVSGYVTLTNCYSSGAIVSVLGGAVVAGAPNAFFDVSSFSPGRGAIELKNGASFYDGGFVQYGANNPYDIMTARGGIYFYSAVPTMTATTANMSISGIDVAWAALPARDLGDGSGVMLATQGIGSTSIFADASADLSLASNVLADITGVTTTVVCAVAGYADVDFTISGFADGATTGVGFELDIGGVLITRAKGRCDSTVAGLSANVTIRSKVQLAAGSNIIKAQYICGAGTTLHIRPATQRESCTITVQPQLR